MPIISGGVIMPGLADHYGTDAPTAGTNAVQTITFTNANGGNFRLSFDGHHTSAITWSNNATTLVANIDTALEALPNIGTNGVTVANSDLNAGNGSVTVTFNGATSSKRVQPAISVHTNSLTGTNNALAVNAITTNGVNATIVNAPAGARYTDTTNGVLYVNTGDDGNPTWTAQT